MQSVTSFFNALCGNSFIFGIACLLVLACVGSGCKAWFDQIGNKTLEDKIKKILLLIAVIGSLAVFASGGPRGLRNEAAKEKLVLLISSFQDSLSSDGKKWALQQLQTLDLDDYDPPPSDSDDSWR
jgi:hypothetical protein